MKCVIQLLVEEKIVLRNFWANSSIYLSYVFKKTPFLGSFVLLGDWWALPVLPSFNCLQTIGIKNYPFLKLLYLQLLNFEFSYICIMRVNIVLFLVLVLCFFFF